MRGYFHDRGEICYKTARGIFEIPRFRHPRLSNPRIDAKFEIVVQRAPWDRSQLPNRPKRIAVTKHKLGRSPSFFDRRLGRGRSRRSSGIREAQRLVRMRASIERTKPRSSLLAAAAANTAKPATDRRCAQDPQKRHRDQDAHQPPSRRLEDAATPSRTPPRLLLSSSARINFVGRTERGQSV